MSTIVFLHAHPDDESSLTAGTMALAADAGHRVVVVYATEGDHGSRPADLPAEISTSEHRHGEAEASAAVTGTARVAWLGYRDSGMTGWEQNADPDCLARADAGDAAEALAAILDEEDADVLVGYDHHGGYGHPDHIRVHEIGTLAAKRAARPPRLLEATRSTDAVNRLRTHPEAERLARDLGLTDGLTDEVWDRVSLGDDGKPVGIPESEIAWEVVLDDEAVDRKRRAMACHASQADDIGVMLAMPPGLFRAMFGVEYYAEPGRGPMRRAWPFDEPDPAPAPDTTGVEQPTAGAHPEEGPR